jgi:hypothetical protein
MNLLLIKSVRKRTSHARIYQLKTQRLPVRQVL